VIKQQLKKILQKSGLLEKIQYSRWYRNYRFPGHKHFLRDNFDFYKKHLGNPGLVFDIGANVGDHTRNLSRIATKVVTVEPDKQNLRILKSRFGSRGNISIVPKAISNQRGTATFYSEGAGSPFNSLSSKWVETLGNDTESRFKKKSFNLKYEVDTITVEDLIEQYGVPDFVKVDVEGFEKQVFEPLQHCIPVINFESNLPEFAAETIWIISKLNSLSPGYRFNFFKDYSGFELDRDVNAAEAISFIEKTELRFLEIICKLK
jgi:FkbM family methyltransferase